MKGTCGQVVTGSHPTLGFLSPHSWLHPYTCPQGMLSQPRGTGRQAARQLALNAVSCRRPLQRRTCHRLLSLPLPSLGGDEGLGLSEGVGLPGEGAEAQARPGPTEHSRTAGWGPHSTLNSEGPTEVYPSRPHWAGPQPKNSQEGTILKAILVFPAHSVLAGRRAARRAKPAESLHPSPLPESPPGASTSPPPRPGPGSPAHLLDVLQRPAVLGLRLLDLQQAAVPLVILGHAHFLEGDTRREPGRRQACARGPPGPGCGVAAWDTAGARGLSLPLQVRQLRCEGAMWGEPENGWQCQRREGTQQA